MMPRERDAASGGAGGAIFRRRQHQKGIHRRRAGGVGVLVPVLQIIDDLIADGKMLSRRARNGAPVPVA